MDSKTLMDFQLDGPPTHLLSHTHTYIENAMQSGQHQACLLSQLIVQHQACLLSQLIVQLTQQGHPTANPVLLWFVRGNLHANDKVGGVASGGEGTPPLTRLVHWTPVGTGFRQVRALARLQPHLIRHMSHLFSNKLNCKHSLKCLSQKPPPPPPHPHTHTFLPTTATRLNKTTGMAVRVVQYHECIAATQ